MTSDPSESNPSRPLEVVDDEAAPEAPTAPDDAEAGGRGGGLRKVFWIAAFALVLLAVAALGTTGYLGQREMRERITALEGELVDTRSALAAEQAALGAERARANGLQTTMGRVNALANQLAASLEELQTLTGGGAPAAAADVPSADAGSGVVDPAPAAEAAPSEDTDSNTLGAGGAALDTSREDAGAAPPAEDAAVVEAPAAEDAAAVEAPAAEDAAVVEGPTAEDAAVVEAPAAEDTAAVEAPAAEDTAAVEAPAAANDAALPSEETPAPVARAAPTPPVDPVPSILEGPEILPRSAALEPADLGAGLESGPAETAPDALPPVSAGAPSAVSDGTAGATGAVADGTAKPPATTDGEGSEPVPLWRQIVERLRALAPSE